MQFLKLTFSIFFLMIPIFSNAQLRQEEVLLEFGDRFRRSQRFGFHKVVGTSEKGVFSLFVKEKHFLGMDRQQKVYYLQYFDEKMNLVESEPLKFISNNSTIPLNFECVVQLGKSLYLFASGFNNETGDKKLFAQEIDPKSLKLKGNLEPIAGLSNSGKAGLYSFSLSPDKTKVLLMYEQATALKGKEAFTMVVLNEDLKLQWQKEDFLPYEDKLFNLEKSTIDDEGNVYLLSTRYQDNRRIKRDGEPNYQYHLLSFKKNGRETNEYSIELANRFLTDIQVVVDEDGDVIGGGFFSDKGSWEIKGSYFFRIDGKTNEVTSKSVKQFSPEFFKQNLPEFIPGNTLARRNQFQLKLKDFRLHNILLRDDGSAVLIGEQYFVTTETTIHERKGRVLRSNTQYHYEFNDVLMVNVDTEGEIDWTTKISKKQHSINDAGIYSSYAVNMIKDDLYFLFNHYPAKPGEEVGKKKKSEKGKAKEVRLVKVDARGNKVEGAIPGLEGADINLMPSSARKLGETEMIIYSNEKRKSRFIKIKFQHLESFFAEKH